MDRMNYKLLNKIGSSILAQFPPDSLVQANNALVNEFNNFLKNSKKQGYECLLHNKKCSGNAIDSHSIPKRNLRMMSNDSKVYVLKDDFKNPFKASLSTTYIKSTLTFWGFCKYHDNSLFQEIENKNIAQYDNKDVFFLSYRALAKEYSDIRECIQRYSWMLDNWKSETRKRFDKEWALFQADKMKNLNMNVIQREKKFLETYIERRVFDKQRVKATLRKCHIQELHLKRELESFNDLINNGEIFKSYYVIFQNEKQIAFSLAHYFSINRTNIYIYFISLPQKEGSLMILSCRREDYDYIKDYSEIKKLFSGDEILMNIFLNQFKEKIAIGGKDIESNYADSFFLEWDVPLATIPYFKLKR